jgi:excisionase family DNA binding protein
MSLVALSGAAGFLSFEGGNVMSVVNSEEALLSRSDAARLLGVSPATLSRLMANGAIEYYKTGWRTQFDLGQIRAYKESVRTRRGTHAKEDEQASAA